MRKLKGFIRLFLLRRVYQWRWLHNASKYKMRPAILRYYGSTIGENVYLSHDIYFDDHLEYLTIGDDVVIGPKAALIFHKRDMRQFKYGDKYLKTPHIMQPIVLSNNSLIGAGAMILPGVTIGEGSIVGAGSVVAKDVPPWSVVAGNPAKVIKQFAPHES